MNRFPARSVRSLCVALQWLAWSVPADADVFDAARDFSLSGMIGTVTVDNLQWQRLDLRPRLKIGPFEAAFDVELFLDEGGRIRDKGWDFSTRRSGLESAPGEGSTFYFTIPLKASASPLSGEESKPVECSIHKLDCLKSIWAESASRLFKPSSICSRFASPGTIRIGNRDWGRRRDAGAPFNEIRVYDTVHRFFCLND